MIAIIDYGMGNLRSVQKALEKIGAKTTITQSPETILSAKKAILPGVGAMRPAMDRLEDLQLVPVIKKFIASGRPFLGICLGLQLLFETSTEGGTTPGLGLLKGGVERFSQLKIPQIGWNQIKVIKPVSPLFRSIANEANVYFCHSYFVKPLESSITTATTDYGLTFTSSVCKNNIYGVQFHPEKSQKVGLQILRNFQELSR